MPLKTSGPRQKRRVRSCGPVSVEVAIVGGGLVGSALATALATGGIAVALIDSADPAELVASGRDGRASAIAAASCRLFQASGVWRHVEPHATPIRHIRVAERDTPFFLHYDHREVGPEPMGNMVPNRALLAGLLNRVAELDAIRHMAPARVSTITRNESGVDIELEDGVMVAARLAVGADGRNSWMRREAGIRVTELKYGQTALVCTVAHEKPHGYVAHELFRPQGPFAILPLAGNRSNIVWCEPHATARAIAALDDAAFMAELRLRFGGFLGTLELEGSRHAYPLSLQYASRIIDRRLALAGDAAHAMHPVAGQGLNIGLRDVAALAEVIVDAVRAGQDPGAPAVLSAYARWRAFDTAVMIASTDGIVRLFSNRIGLLKVVRDLGLAAVNRIPPLRRQFIRHAMGISGTLPRLLDGRAL